MLRAGFENLSWTNVPFIGTIWRMTVPTAPQPSTSTTARVLDVLQVLADTTDPIGVSEIARCTGLGKAVVHRILQTFTERGFAIHDAGSRRYLLGPAAIGMAGRASGQNPLLTAAQPALDRLAAITGETTTLCARHGYERYYIGQVESRQRIRITVMLGERVPLTSGASGAAILAFLPDDVIEDVLRIPVPQYTDETVTDAGTIRERLAEVRRQGWAWTEGERVRYSSSVAAPVFDPTGAVIGSISLAYLAERAHEQKLADLASLVVEAAAQTTEALRARA